ncbi:MAG TPA: VOC family protein [Thermoplasmata archaeon]
MRFEFEYTGLRVRDLDAAIDFFTKVLEMKLEARVKADWNKGEFANLWSPDRRHKLELSRYEADSPVAGPFREGDELDHLGFGVDDFDAALRRLEAAGYKPALGPFHEGVWHIAFVPVVEGIWLDVYHVDAPKQAKRKRPKRTGKRRKR